MSKYRPRAADRRLQAGTTACMGTILPRAPPEKKAGSQKGRRKRASKERVATKMRSDANIADFTSNYLLATIAPAQGP
jgi:hypothetical protein